MTKMTDRATPWQLAALTIVSQTDTCLKTPELDHYKFVLKFHINKKIHLFLFSFLLPFFGEAVMSCLLHFPKKKNGIIHWSQFTYNYFMLIRKLQLLFIIHFSLSWQISTSELVLLLLKLLACLRYSSLINDNFFLRIASLKSGRHRESQWYPDLKQC